MLSPSEHPIHPTTTKTLLIKEQKEVGDDDDDDDNDDDVMCVPFKSQEPSFRVHATCLNCMEVAKAVGGGNSVNLLTRFVAHTISITIPLPSLLPIVPHPISLSLFFFFGGGASLSNRLTFIIFERHRDSECTLWSANDQEISRLLRYRSIHVEQWVWF